MIHFAAYTAAEIPNAFQWAGQLPKIASSRGESVSPPELALKRHLDRFSGFCRARPCDQHTDTQRDHATCDISNRLHVCNVSDVALN